MNTTESAVYRWYLRHNGRWLASYGNGATIEFRDDTSSSYTSLTTVREAAAKVEKLLGVRPEIVEQETTTIVSYHVVEASAGAPAEGK